MPSASMKAAACCAISSMEVGTLPLELETPALLNRNHFAVLGKSVGQREVPVIHGPGKVHEEEQGDVDRYAEATVREANAGPL
jgi:hypothetical protein